MSLLNDTEEIDTEEVEQERNVIINSSDESSEGSKDYEADTTEELNQEID